MLIFSAFIVALLVALLFAPGYRKGSFAPLIVFFMILFLAGIASQYWIMPFGPVWWGVSWMPLLFIILLFSFLFSAPSPYEKRAAKSSTVQEATSIGVAAVSIFIWLLLVLLL